MDEEAQKYLLGSSVPLWAGAFLPSARKSFAIKDATWAPGSEDQELGIWAEDRGAPTHEDLMNMSSPWKHLRSLLAMAPTPPVGSRT